MPDVTVFASGLHFPESPRWHDGHLWLADITGRAIHRYAPSGEGGVHAHLDTEPSGLGFAPDGSILAVDMPGRRLLSVTASGTTPIADLSDHAPSFCNDMAVAADGTAYVTQLGNNHWKGEPPRQVPVIRVSPDGKVEPLGPDLRGPNGIALTPDGQTLLVAEPGAGRIYYMHLDSSGAVRDHGVHANLPPAAGSKLPFATPDGICLDASGGLWIADPTGHQVIHIDAGGRVTDSIAFPDGIPLAVAVGGTDGGTLYVAVSAHADFYAPPRDPKGYIAALTI